MQVELLILLGQVNNRSKYEGFCIRCAFFLLIRTITGQWLRQAHHKKCQAKILSSKGVNPLIRGSTSFSNHHHTEAEQQKCKGSTYSEYKLTEYRGG
jgi:hypothetical protein